MPDDEVFYEVCRMHAGALSSCDCECTCGTFLPGLHAGGCRVYDPECGRKAGNRFYVKKRPTHA